MNIKKGDIVGRISYGKDILFSVEKIIKINVNNEICILKGLTERIKADAPIEDLEIIDKKTIDKHMNYLTERVAKRIKKVNESKILKRDSMAYTGIILHLDRDSCLDNKNSHWLKILNLKKKYLTTN